LLPRSLFFSYEPRGAFLAKAKDKVSIDLGSWKEGTRSGKLTEIQCPKSLGTWPVKHYATLFVNALAPDLELLRIDEKTFVDFLTQEGAEHDSWTLRFWEIDPSKGISRAITAGREKPSVWPEIANSMNRAGRRTAWAGAEFTHPKFEARVTVHRYPTASIAPWGEGGTAYLKVKKRFVDLLEQIVK